MKIPGLLQRGGVLVTRKTLGGRGLLDGAGGGLAGGGVDGHDELAIAALEGDGGGGGLVELAEDAEADLGVTAEAVGGDADAVEAECAAEAEAGDVGDRPDRVGD